LSQLSPQLAALFPRYFFLVFPLVQRGNRGKWQVEKRKIFEQTAANRWSGHANTGFACPLVSSKSHDQAVANLYCRIHRAPSAGKKSVMGRI